MQSADTKPKGGPPVRLSHLVAVTTMALTSLAGAQTTGVTQEALQRQLREEGARLNALYRSLDDAQRQLDASRRELEAQRARINAIEEQLAGRTGTNPAGALPAQARQSPPAASEPLAQAEGAAPAPVPPSPAKAPPGTNGSPPVAAAAPGSFSVDPDAAQRALDRTLTEFGALLVPLGKSQLTPSFSYTRREVDFVTNTLAVNPTQKNPDLAAARGKVERDELVGALGLVVGLPWDSQVELGIPYSWVNQQNAYQFSVVGGPQQQFSYESRKGSGFGNFTVGFAKTLMREKDWRPDLIGRVTYNTGSGVRVDNGVPLAGQSGYSSVGASFSALKRQDPLAFVLQGSFQRFFENEGVQIGNQYGLNFGTVLAASPNTSLQFNFGMTFGSNSSLNGRSLTGSGTNQGVLSIGASSILGRGFFLTITAGLGLTRDSPDYFFAISIPYLFDTPFL